VDPVIILFGLGVGTLIGLTGVGGGSLMTPLLLLVGGYTPSVAIGTDLAYGAITKTLGGWRHLRAGNVDLRLSQWLAFGSVPGSVCGVITLDYLEGHYGKDFESTLLALVASALALAAAAILYRSLFRPGLVAKERDHALLDGRHHRFMTVSIGATLGFILGLTSVGSGALIGLALILLYKLRPRRVVGTDVFHAAVVMWAAAIAHLFSGNIDFGLMGTILIGSLPGVWIGTHLVPVVPVGALRITLGAVLTAASLGVFSKSGVGVPAVAIIGAPVLIGAFAFWLHRRRESIVAVALPD
jgi:uncharacterized membrane protein YfcA